MGGRRNEHRDQRGLVVPDRAARPDLAQTKPLQFAAGDTLVTEGVLTATQTGPLGTIKATNKPVVLHFVDIVQVADGKVVQRDSYSNSAEILIAIGAMPAPGAAAPAGSGSAFPIAAPMVGAKPK